MPQNVPVEWVINFVARGISQADGQKFSDLANVSSVVFDLA